MEFEIESCDVCSKTVCSSSDYIPVLSKSFSYNEFFRNYLEPNVPCIIKNITDQWEAHSKWVDDRRTPNVTYLRDKYGTCDVTVYKCNERYFNSQKTESCKFARFLDSWGCGSSKREYLKDWHLKNTHENDDFYQVPIYFASDWLNEFLVASREDDYRFVYMGQGGTWTPFHVDVFNSYSWSANVCGRKRWVLFPPGEENFLRDSLNNLPYDISDIYGARGHVEIVQNAGEAIFVPSGWYHQVWNLEDTISVNHNWVNGCNMMKMWSAIDESLTNVKKEIADCREADDFIEQCQRVLKASFGMDFFKFFQFLEFIANKRLLQIEKNESETGFHGHRLGSNHAIYDLKSLKTVIKEFVNHEDIPHLFKLEIEGPKKLLKKITDCLLFK